MVHKGYRCKARAQGDAQACLLEQVHQKAGELVQCEASIELSGAADGKYV